jgi:hypothetical protein
LSSGLWQLAIRLQHRLLLARLPILLFLRLRQLRPPGASETSAYRRLIRLFWRFVVLFFHLRNYA